MTSKVHVCGGGGWWGDVDTSAYVCGDLLREVVVVMSLG